jgi:hypothetical protein
MSCPISKDDLAFPNTDGGFQTITPFLRITFRLPSWMQYSQNIKYPSTQLGPASIGITDYGSLRAFI